MMFYYYKVRSISRSLQLILLVSILYLPSLEAIHPYKMMTVYIDQGSVCKPHEFKKVRGLSGYILSHDSSLPYSYRAGQQCFLTIEVPENYQIAVEAVELNLGYPPNPPKCHSDSLFIFDNQPENGNIVQSNLDMLGEFCSMKNRTTLAVSSNNSITLYWHAAEMNKRYPNSRGFKLRWFVMKRKMRGNVPNSAVCNPDTDFMCADHESCIPLPLACDSVQHCYDGSDTIKRLQKSAGCENIETDMFGELGGAAIAGIVLSIILILVVMVGTLLYCCLSHQRQTASNHNTRNLTYQPAPTNPHLASKNGGSGGRGGSNSNAGSGSGGSERSHEHGAPPPAPCPTSIHVTANNYQGPPLGLGSTNVLPAVGAPPHKSIHNHTRQKSSNFNDHMTNYNNHHFNAFNADLVHHKRQEIV